MVYITTRLAREYWMDKDTDIFIWRYIATDAGTFVLYPQGQIPENYHITKRPW